VGLSETIQDTLRANGAVLVGFADLSDVSEGLRPELTTAVSVAVALDPVIVDGIRGGPTEDYFHLYKRVNARLAELTGQAADLLKQAGFRARPIAPTVVLLEELDIETYTMPFSHKMAATRAGLGWIGKCALLVTPEYGSALRLATVLTDADFSTGTPITECRCGECTNCADVCPGGAPSGKIWDVTMHRDDFFDPHACVRGIQSHQKDFGHVCGMCIAACPFTEEYLQRELPQA